MKINKLLKIGSMCLISLGLLTGCESQRKTLYPQIEQKEINSPSLEKPFIPGIPMDYYINEEEQKPLIYFVPIKDNRVAIYDVKYTNPITKYENSDPQFIYTTTLPYEVKKTEYKNIYQIIMQANEKQLKNLPKLMSDAHNKENQIILDITEKDGLFLIGWEYTSIFNEVTNTTEYKINKLNKNDLLGKNKIQKTYLSPSIYANFTNK